MAITLNTLSYNQDSWVNKDRLVYVGPSNTFQVKDTLTLGRTTPTASATYSGNARYQVKRVKSLTLTGALSTKADAIVDVSISIPVGAANADIDALLDDVGDWLASADGKTMVKTFDITW